MSRFHAYCGFSNPGLHIWRQGTNTKLFLHPSSQTGNNGWFEFRYDFEPSIAEPVRFMLFDFSNGAPTNFESDLHQRQLPRKADGTFADDVWFTHGTRRVLDKDPFAQPLNNLRIHVISQSRLRPSQIYIWDGSTNRSRQIYQSGENAYGPYFDLVLLGQERSLFNFKFIGRDEHGNFSAHESDQANRLWSSADRGEIWTHSYAAEVVSRPPEKKTLRVRLRQDLSAGAGKMRLWRKNSDFSDDAAGVVEPSGWTLFQADIYTDMAYGIQFWNTNLPEATRWEHPEAKREIRISADTDLWTLEGDGAWFPAEPKRDKQVDLHIALRPPGCALQGQLSAHVWINRARAPIESAVTVSPAGVASFSTYSNVVTSVRFFDSSQRWETIDRHPFSVPASETGTTTLYAVLDRPTLLTEAPPEPVFQNPPFTIQRPGAYEDQGYLHFVVHAPKMSRARLIGKWTGWLNNPIEMRSTTDGTYWWARISKQELINGLGDGATDYHGAEYKFLFNDNEHSQDPAAGWMESSWNQAESKLVQSDKFVWSDQSWQRPGWEHLTIYQLHVARFTNRFQTEAPLRRVAREIDTAAGYLRDLGITAILILPVNEVGTQNSWGYDPAYFYGIENDFGGPDAMKELVDTCHRHGLAVLVDVVFNHAGSTDNILWSVSRESYFDGDTKWGAMINFDHPQCRHFFAQNLVYLAKEYHIDGFRFDHTATIIHSKEWDPWSGFVTVRGSGGGWEFLHALRHALRTQVGDRCLLMAEHLPNEWSLTNFNGPMDTQWCDAYHDRMVDACRRQYGMSQLADAFQLSHTACDEWYNVTNYPESHDEVGNVRDRISFVAGWGQGLRMSKVAAAGTMMSRGIPMYFMGAESAEDQQFAFGASNPLDLDAYQASPDRGRVRAWWSTLAKLRQNSSIKGPSPLAMCFADGQMMAFSRGGRGDFFVVLNFGGWAGWHSLAYLNLPSGSYRELWNSTWPAFAIQGENEGEHGNGGREARLDRGKWLQIPDYGAVILERVG